MDNLLPPKSLDPISEGLSRSVSVASAPALASKPKKSSKSSDEDDGKPRRPLSAYNIFFKNECMKILEVTPIRKEGKPRRSHGKIGLADLVRTVAGKWRVVDPHERAYYDYLAAQDKLRYRKELKEYKKAQENAQKTHQQAAHGVNFSIATAAPTIANSDGMSLMWLAQQRLQLHHEQTEQMERLKAQQMEQLQQLVQQQQYLQELLQQQCQFTQPQRHTQQLQNFSLVPPQLAMQQQVLPPTDGCNNFSFEPATNNVHESSKVGMDTANNFQALSRSSMMDVVGQLEEDSASFLVNNSFQL